MKERLKSQASTGVFILAVVGILVLVNIVSVRLFGRVDITHDRMYSLSQASKDMMRNLDDQVHAKAYFTSDLPAPYNHHTRFVRDLFEEYAAYSKGKFKFEFIDPGEKEDQRNSMMLLGIPPVQIQEIRDDKFQVKQAFLGIVFYYADKKEVIPVVKSTQGLEYELTSTIRRLTNEKIKTIGFLKGHDEPKLQEEMRQISQMLEKNYKTKEIDLSGEKKEIPADVDALVVVNPAKKFEDADLYQIDQFLMKGKNIAFFANSVKVELQSFSGTNVDSGLNKLLKHYGIGINNDLVADLQNKRINVSSQQGQFRISNIVNYALIPVITNFNKDNSLTSKLDALSLPFVSSLELSGDTEKVKYTVLGRSSQRSWLQTGQYRLNPMQDITPTGDAKLGPFPVMAMAKGRFSSYFADKLDASSIMGDAAIALKESPETRLLVIGDGNFVLDNFGDQANAVFFLNSLDWLVQDEALISIRGRGIENKPVATLENWEKSALKYMNMIGVPVLFILFGFFRWSMRRARRRGFQLASK